MTQNFLKKFLEKTVAILNSSIFFIYLLTSLFYCFNAKSEIPSNERIDSLLNILNQPLSDTTKINTLNQLSWEYIITGQHKLARPIIEEALNKSRSINYLKGVASAINNNGIIFQTQSNFSEAYKYYLESLKINESIGYQKGIAFSNQSVGVIYFIQGNFQEAIKYYMTALEIYKTIKDEKGIAYIYSNIGNCYSRMNKYIDAINNFEAALNIFIGLNSTGGACLQYIYIGDTHYQQGNFDKSLENYNKALHLAEEDARENFIVLSQVNIGTVKIKLKQYKEARNDLNNALVKLAKGGKKENLRNLYKSLSTLDSIDGNWQSAYTNQLLYVAYKDSVKNDENAQKTVEAQMRYAFDIKESKMKAEQEKKDIRNRIFRNSIAGGLAGTLVFSVLVYRQRNKIAKEKKRSEELLLNILPAKTAEELKNTGTTKAKHFDQVTVLFTDFKNFTATSEAMSAQELVNEINFCYSEFDKITTKHNVEKIKTIGDSYMCAGGLPIPNKTNAEDTVRAALEIRNFMNKESKKRELEGKTFFEIRIGINTGPIVAGVVGTKKFAYDIWGDTVNIASRMESSGVPGKVNISESTYQLVKEKFDCTHRGKIEAKNKGEIDMYFIENHSNKS